MYRGKIENEGKNWNFRFDEFELFIFNNEQKYIESKVLNSLIKDDWICLQDSMGNILYIKIGKYMITASFEFRCFADAYIIKYSRDKKIDSTISPKYLFLRSDVLDYLFRNNKIFKSEAVRQLVDWNSTKSKLEETREQRKKLDVDFGNGKRTVQFGTMIQGCDAPFPYEIRNYMKIDFEDVDNIENIWQAVNTIRYFLKFISQCPNVNFWKHIWLVQDEEDINNCDTFMYVRPETCERGNAERVLLYEDIETGIEKIMEMINKNQVCFRSLFVADYDIITYADIMNTCAAFEAQFNEKYKNTIKFKEQENVKKKMIELLKESRDAFTNVEQVYFDEILAGMKNVKETLRERLQMELDSFVNIYGKLETECDFYTGYEQMPSRIKDSRNALDHGNIDYQFKNIMFLDAELLRAVIYKMILETAGINDKDKLVNCLKKLSNHPF